MRPPKSIGGNGTDAVSRLGPAFAGSTVPSRRGTSRSASSQDSARTVQAIYGTFKDKTFSGDALQSIEETIRDYNILGNQLLLRDEMKAKFLMCIFEEAAKSDFISNCREDITFTEMEKVMRDEFESDARRLHVNMALRGLKVERVMSENENVVDGSDALNWLVKCINNLKPQFPEGFRSQDNKIQFLRHADIGIEWASQAISQITTSKYSFKGVISALREGLQYGEEVRRHESAA